MSDPSLGFVATRQRTHVQVIRKDDGGVSLVDLRTLAALDLDAENRDQLRELLDRAAMPGQPHEPPAPDAGPTEGEPMEETEITREDGTTAPETYARPGSPVPGEVTVPGTGTGTGTVPGEVITAPGTGDEDGDGTGEDGDTEDAGTGADGF